MILDTASKVDTIEETDLRKILDEVWNDILLGWEEHPSYNGLPFIGIFNTHYSLTNLKLVEENKNVDIHNTRSRMCIDISVASKLLKVWEEKGWIKSLDNGLKDYKLL